MIRLDGYLKANFDIILKEAIPNKWDALTVIFGREGTGKTTLAVQLAKYTDNDFNLSRCVFTPQQFNDAIDNAPPESAIVWDEAITGANISTHASEISVSIVSKLTQIRKKKLKLFLCFPYLHMLNKYFVSRCICSIYVYAKDFNDRGYGFFYTQPQTEFLYNYMKERFRYSPLDAIKKSAHAFYFKYPKKFYLPETEYDDKKENSRVNTDRMGDKWKDRTIQLIIALKKHTTLGEISQILGVTTQYMNQLTNKKYSI